MSSGKLEELKTTTEAAQSSADDAPISCYLCCPPETSAAPPLCLGCTSKTGNYSLGTAQRPAIHHDNGFLQNPIDPSDPNPIATTAPSFADRASLAYWVGKLEVAEAAQGVPGVPHNDLPDGIAAYRHFLYGGGADRAFSYERFIANDPSGPVVLRNAIRDIQLCAEKLYNQLVANDTLLKTKRLTFELTGSQLGVGSTALATLYPYPQTENWQKAIGAHVIWMSSSVEVEPAHCTGDGEPVLKMLATLHAEDRYNFNPGANDIATGTADAENGRFEATGLAHQYMNYSSIQRNVTWTLGRPENGIYVKTDVSRQRKPNDNLRVRNRL